jgi:hypothetical protein
MEQSQFRQELGLSAEKIAAPSDCCKDVWPSLGARPATDGNNLIHFGGGRIESAASVTLHARG